MEEVEIRGLIGPKEAKIQQQKYQVTSGYI